MTETFDTKGRLIGKILVDWCSRKQEENSNMHFKKSLCSGSQNIRFTSDNINSVFPQNEYEDGYILCYEIQNRNEGIFVTVAMNKLHVGKRLQKRCAQLLRSMNLADCENEKMQLKTWNVSDKTASISQMQDSLNQIYDYEISYFETELKAWLSDHNRKIKNFPELNQKVISSQELPDEILIEGAMKEVLSNKYERNLKARSRCIAHYGTACMVCGFDFGDTYGEAFSGKIEVHHKKPLYEIKENYVVNPIEDLIPVCPNCHLILHSKKDGVYTVAEIKERIHQG